MEPQNCSKNWLRLIARIMSVGIIGFTLVMLMDRIFFPEPSVQDYPRIERLLPVVMWFSVMGLTLAFCWDQLGGAITPGFFLLHLHAFWWIRKAFLPLGMRVVFYRYPSQRCILNHFGWLDLVQTPQESASCQPYIRHQTG